jgi:hypothetical protein
VDYLVPALLILLDLRGVKADTVAPEVMDLSHLKFQVFKLGLLGHLIRVLAEFEVEIIEAGLDVDAL